MKKNVLDFLQDNKGSFISGTYISDKMGISRAAVWKQIRQLRQVGYSIIARPNYGYCLEKEPDLLNSTLLSNQLINYYKVLDSTNLAARHLAEQGCPTYTTVIAEEQLKGRGRRGRSWFSPSNSGLWFSIVLRPEMISPATAAPITLVTAAALASSLKKYYELAIKIKWPNDLLIGRKKFGGILSEIKGEPDRVEYLVIGTGLNINQRSSDFPPDLQDKATSLLVESGRFFKRTELFLSLWRDLCQAYDIFFREGFAPFHGKLLTFNNFIDQNVSISWPGGSVKGLVLDLDQDGALIIKDSQGDLKKINYGEIN